MLYFLYVSGQSLASSIIEAFVLASRKELLGIEYKLQTTLEMIRLVRRPAQQMTMPQPNFDIQLIFFAKIHKEVFNNFST